MKRNFDLLANLAEKYDKPIALAKKNNGKWHNLSTKQYINTVNNVSYGLLTENILPGQCVAIMSENRQEWNCVDFGISQIGAVSVPLYPTLAQKDLIFILNDSETQIVFVESEELVEKIKLAWPDIKHLKAIYTFENVAREKNWNELLEKGASNKHPEKLEQLKNKVDADDTMTLIYTSGTTGIPKGVMLSHHNIISNVAASAKVCPINHTHKVLSFLPLSHIFERMICYLYHYTGATVYYAESMETIGDNLKEIKPFAFSTVPRLLEKVYDKIVAKGNSLIGLKYKLFFWALNLGLRYELNWKNGPLYHLQLMLANALIFNKWRKALGNNVGVIVSGGAALQPRLARVFTAAKINVLEGYGLTETSPVICVNRMQEKNRMFGTVGLALDNVKVKIAEDGEILCKGPNVMKGYYKNKKATDEAIDKDGWFHTGDIGEMVDKRFLKITDRKKEIFKTSGGKFIAPQVMENKFSESIYIEQIMIIGEGEKHPAALIVPNFEELKKWCIMNNIGAQTKMEMAQASEVREKLSEELEVYNKNFGGWEQIKKYEIISSEWTIDGGELTPKLSLRRKAIMEKYKDLIEKIYNG